MKYFDKIDGLRFLAIFFVLIHHFASYLSNFIDWGYYGVDLFFVISGFLITNILLNLKHDGFKRNYLNFMGRRVLRIFPLYYFVTILLILLNIPDVRNYAISLLTYTFNYKYPFLEGKEGHIFSHFWSLSVEEQFYLFWPILILIIRHNKTLVLAVVVSIIIIAFLQIELGIFPKLTAYNYSGLLSRMGSLGMGALGGIIQSNYKIPKKIFDNTAIEIAMFVTLIFALIKFIPFLLALSSLFLTLKAVNFGFKMPMLNEFLSNNKIKYIGTISYGIYIYHLPIGYYVMPEFFDPLWQQINFESLGRLQVLKWHSWIIKFPLYSLVSIGVAAISFKYFEKPLLALKNKFFKY